MTLSRREFAFAVPSAALLAGLRTAPSGDDPLEVRKDFPALDEVTYLNTAYSGLLSQAVVDAGHDWLESRARRTHLVQSRYQVWTGALRGPRERGRVATGGDTIGQILRDPFVLSGLEPAFEQLIEKARWAPGRMSRSRTIAANFIAPCVHVTNA